VGGGEAPVHTTQRKTDVKPELWCESFTASRWCQTGRRAFTASVVTVMNYCVAQPCALSVRPSLHLVPQLITADVLP
jgi:hypothetical protein